MAFAPEDLANLVKSCFGAFRRLSLLKGCNTDLETAALSTVVAFSAWEDEAGRIRVWSGNLGAHQYGTSSLSYRLRHAPSIKQEITDTLNVLLGAVNEAADLLEDHLSSHNGVDGEYVKELYKDVVDSIEGLFRLSTAIRNPSRRDQIIRRSQIDKSMEPFDQNHVRDMLPRASPLLVERLGRANTQRRANFRYLQRHHEKLAEGLVDKDDDHETKSKMSGTIASELVAQVVSGHEDDSMSVAGSATSYAPSLFDSTRRFPSKPKPTTADGRFECPLCFYMIKANSITAWRKHVFVDLQPYTCLFSECAHSNKLFTSRRDWYAHEMQQHTEIGFSQCPLCKEPLSFSTAEKHLGRHLEDLALFALPSALFDNEDDGEGEVGMEDASDEEGSRIEALTEYGIDVMFDNEDLTIEVGEVDDGSFQSEMEDLGANVASETNELVVIESSDSEIVLKDSPENPQKTVVDDSTKASSDTQDFHHPAAVRAVGDYADRSAENSNDRTATTVDSSQPPMWTEVSRESVSKEAIEEQGYDYEETKDFFYITEYLKDKDVRRLIELTEDLKAKRVAAAVLLKDHQGQAPEMPLQDSSKTIRGGTDHHEKEKARDECEAIVIACDRGRDRHMMTEESALLMGWIPRQRKAMSRSVSRESSALEKQKSQTEDAGSSTIPAGARWTKIAKKIVSVEVLEQMGEDFEELEEEVIVKRVLSRDQIQELADATAAQRGRVGNAPASLSPRSVSVREAPSNHPGGYHFEHLPPELPHASLTEAGDSEGHINDTQKDETSPAPLRKPEARSEEAADRSDLSLATWLGVKKKHLRTQILDFYNMPWTDDPEDPDSILVNTGNDRTLLLKLLKAVEHNANRLEMDPRGNEMAVVRRESISKDPTSRS